MSETDNDEERIQIAERLRTAREYMGLSQAQIAQLVGLPRTAITGIETGTRKVEATELKRLSGIYRRSAEYLLTGCEPAYSGPEQFAFLARAVNGLTQKDVDEVARFADFLRASKAS
ncbi:MULTISPECIES: helix-turn-helix domain-containing protein [Pseudomonas]|uniref:Helix-turn-helix domain-containing protein n=1 Tax=Pseudomonas palleroniana TaxID=191390 RepID=A0A1H5KMM0_9PSED|nr:MULTISPECIES: helix-turn-helix transcriptional regulator [Pseudomonas]KAB0568427.1 helix-turn-helix transcriptional regulator [Pseudomonas palleroniana]PTC28737.1 XRE family transcriptional regulator [Pseudomonas palleroniana]SEE66119.1 Helix-turn-helix domain-containing protein [Pseudomonas palleroniana]